MSLQTKPTLYHYTCDHGHHAIGDEGKLVPALEQDADYSKASAIVRACASFVWLTDLDVPFREALGLTSHLVECDRTRYRYRVTDDVDCVPYLGVHKRLPRDMRLAIEVVPGVRPAHWWLSAQPVPVLYDPLPARKVAL